MIPVFCAAGLVGLMFGLSLGPAAGAAAWYAVITPAIAGNALATRK